MELYGEEKRERSSQPRDYFGRFKSSDPRAQEGSSSMFFDNLACLCSDPDMAPSIRTNGDSTTDWVSQQNFADRNSQATKFSVAPSNDLHILDGHSTAYSCPRSEGHIYEEVGPPSIAHHYHTEPYMLSNVGRDRMLNSSASLCSMCSNRCTGPSLPPPLCHCSVLRNSQTPFCNLHNMSTYQMTTPQTLQHTCQSVSSPTCTLHNTMGQGCLHHHHHHTPLEQRYTQTLLNEERHHHQMTDASSDGNNQSLSPFNLLRKCNRDSKASTNTMLDNTSGKSVLMPCGKKMLIGIVATIFVILVISVAVGLVVTFAVEKPSETTPLTVKTSKLEGSLRVISGRNSHYRPDYSRVNSIDFKAYASTFTYQANAILTKGGRLNELVNYTQVMRLRNGSVIIDFLIHLKQELSQTESNELASQVQNILYTESNKSTTFSKAYPIELSSLSIKPYVISADETDEDTQVETTTNKPTSTTPATSTPGRATTPVVTTTATTTSPRYEILPPSGVCQPINDTVCQRIYYNSSGTTFPNFAGHRTQEQAQVMTTIINAIMASTSCYDHLNTFSCALLIPKCGENNKRIPPCRSMCQAAFDRCGVYMSVVMNTMGTRVNCSYFPDSSDPNVCVDENAPVVPTAPPTCPRGYFSCDNHTCHPEKDRCDSVHDCKDKTDEHDCSGFQCVEGQFQCSNGNCRPKVWRCDGRDDCGDGSDEEGCEPIGPCKAGEFKCANGTDVWDHDECIAGSFTCDKTADCTDGSDEDVNFCKDRQR